MHHIRMHTENVLLYSIGQACGCQRSEPFSMASEGLERKEFELPPIYPFKIQILPIAWKTPVTEKLSLQVHPVCVRKIHLVDGSVIHDLERVRDILYGLQRPVINSPYLYAHEWT